MARRDNFYGDFQDLRSIVDSLLLDLENNIGTGTQGPAGPQGIQGEQGIPGVSPDTALYALKTDVTGAISNFPIRTEVTGILVPYATLTGVSASFTTPAQITGAISNFPIRSEVSGAITGALTPYAISSNISSSFVTRTAATASLAFLTASNSFTSNQIIDINSSSPALRVTQRGTGVVLTVEDSANPDTSAFAVLNDGVVAIGIDTGSAIPTSYKLYVVGKMYSTSDIQTPGYVYANYVNALNGINAYGSNGTINGNFHTGSSYTASNGYYGRLFGTSSYALDSNLLDGKDSLLYALKTDVTDALTPYATLTGVSASFATPSQVSSSITASISNFPVRAEVSGAITASLLPYATLTGVSASFTTPSQVSSSITASISNFAVRTEISGAITGALTPYATLTGVSASFTTPAQITGAISNFPIRAEVTGVLGLYATLTGVSSSFVTPVQVSSSITASISNFPVRTEISGAITGALNPYATLTGVSASFTTPAQISSSVTASISNFPVRTEVSGVITSSLVPYATLFGVSSSFTTPDQVSSSITSSLTPYAKLVSNIFTQNQTITGSLFVLNAVSASQLTGSFKGDGSQITNIPSSAVNLTNYATLTGVSASFTTPTQVSGAITGALDPYAKSFDISSSFGTKTDLTASYARLNVSNTFTQDQTITGSLFVLNAVSASQFTGSFKGDGSQLYNVSTTPVDLSPYATLTGVSASFATPVQVSGAVTSALGAYAKSSDVSSSFGLKTHLTASYARLNNINDFKQNQIITGSLFVNTSVSSSAVTSSFNRINNALVIGTASYNGYAPNMVQIYTPNNCHLTINDATASVVLGTTQGVSTFPYSYVGTQTNHNFSLLHNNSAKVVLNSSNFSPINDLSIDLGGFTKRWNRAYIDTLKDIDNICGVPIEGVYRPISLYSTLEFVQGGIAFSTNGDVLSDYEEGTFTAVSSKGSGFNGSGRYIKIGNLVNIHITISAVSPDWNQHDYWTGMPFVASNIASGIFSIGGDGDRLGGVTISSTTLTLRNGFAANGTGPAYIQLSYTT